LQTLEWDLILGKALRGEPVKVRLTTDLSRKNPFYSVLAESPLSAAIEVMRTGVYRVNVTGGEGQVAHVLSQSDILRHLASDSQVLLALRSVHVKDLDIVHRPVIYIEDHETLLKAFSKMIENGISSLAVVDAGRRLVGNISISDVRYIFKHSSMRTLWRTCVEFISSNLHEEGLERGKVPFLALSMRLFDPA
jgi:CBS domain-containing protein